MSGSSSSEGVNRHLHRVASVARGATVPRMTPRCKRCCTRPSPRSEVRNGPGRLAWRKPSGKRWSDGAHLAVQAGTGTGKSLAYLVPALRLAADRRGPVVVSTATIALQRQLVDRDLPRLADALRGPLGRTPEFAILKGRNNYLCLNKLRNAPRGQPGLAVRRAQPARSARTCKRLHQWATTTTTGDRDELVPGVPDQAWRQVAVTARECLGSQPVPVRQSSASPSGRGGWPPRPTSSSPTTRCSPSTRSARAASCPSTAW